MRYRTNTHRHLPRDSKRCWWWAPISSLKSCKTSGYATILPPSPNKLAQARPLGTRIYVHPDYIACHIKSRALVVSVGQVFVNPYYKLLWLLRCFCVLCIYNWTDNHKMKSICFIKLKLQFWDYNINLPIFCRNIQKWSAALAVLNKVQKVSRYFNVRRFYLLWGDILRKRPGGNV